MKIVFTLLCVFSLLIISAQIPEFPIQPIETIYAIVDEYPVPPADFVPEAYIFGLIDSCAENSAINISFIVEKNGSIDGIKVLSSSKAMNAKIAAGLSLIKGWKPARLNGKDVMYRYSVRLICPLRHAFGKINNGSTVY